jgi:hypothetical protein
MPTKFHLKPKKIEGQVFHRRGAKAAEMIDLFFFAAETPAKKNTHALWAEPATLKSLREA